MRKLILASESPRRRQLLEDSGFVFSVVPAHLSEIPDKKLKIDEQILAIARQKAEAVRSAIAASLTEPSLILAADTEVVVDGNTLGKPKDQEDAKRMLRLLSGRPHEVKTGMVLISSEGDVVQHIETTKIIFRNLSPNEIDTYVATGEPLDKAGGYGIQGEARKFVSKVEGDFNNVIGLPIKALEIILKEKNWNVFRK
ncbi:MAG: Maf family protein [Bdellovibrionaceae bacterium]|nr:Maf family protein [Pseudobdellovibrionaceae bacterium]